VFAAHQPLLMILRKIIYRVWLPGTNAAVIILYFLIPICIIAVLVAAHSYMLKTIPAFVAVITGNSLRSKVSRAELCDLCNQ
jgi:hypothetical protein